VDELYASRRRLVLSADAERSRIEHELHGGLQQHLVALATKLELARGTAESDPAVTKALLEELAHEVQQALDEAAQLALRIHPGLLEAYGLAVALRAATASAGIAASVEVAASPSAPPELATTVYLCWLDALDNAGPEGRTEISVREEDGAIVFDVAGGARSDGGVALLRDRVEALGGRLTVESEPGRVFRVSGSLPLPR
jgi:signal transduction histidine kinase